MTSWSYRQFIEAVGKLPNFIWLMDFTQMFPIYVNVFNFTQNLNKAFLICPDLIEAVGPHPNVSNFAQNLNNVFQLAQNLWRLLEFPNDSDSGSVYFAVRSKKNGQIVSAKLLPLIATQTIPHLNVNVAVQFAQMFKIFARKWPIFNPWGCDRIPAPLMPHNYLYLPDMEIFKIEEKNVTMMKRGECMLLCKFPKFSMIPWYVCDVQKHSFLSGWIN